MSLQLIDQHTQARVHGDYDLERKLSSDIRNQVRKDKSMWLGGIVANTKWDKVRKLRKKPPTDSYCFA